MRTSTGLIAASFCLAAGTLASAQREGAGEGRRQERGDDLVSRMMAFDKDKDGKLTKSEVIDARLNRLFERADANKDGTVTKEELTVLAAKEAANDRGGPGFGPPGSGPRGGGPMMTPPRPGEILPPMMRQRLGLSSEQQADLEQLQKDVDSRLEKILNDEQRKQLREMRERGPGRFGPPGGFGPAGGGSPGGPPRGDGPPPSPPDR
jgi:hypothetical protein